MRSFSANKESAGSINQHRLLILAGILLVPLGWSASVLSSPGIPHSFLLEGIWMGVAGLCLWRSLTDKGKHHTEAMVFGLILLYYLFDWYTLSFGPVPPGFALGHIIWLSLSAKSKGWIS